VTDYHDRIEQEAATGHPAWPCYRCGRDDWQVERPFRKTKADRTCLYPAICGHCHIMETAMHIDGGWMGMHVYSRSPQSLYAFVQEHATWLRGTVR
jgi:hypothetical protein